MASALGLLPRWLRERIVLPRLVLDDGLLANVVVKVATTRDEVFGAARLVHDAYVGRGIMPAHASRLKLGPQLVLPSTLTFIASANDVVVGTMSVVADSPLGLPMDASFRHELRFVRERGERIAEVSALAVAREYRHSGLVYLLYRLAFHSAIASGLDCGVMTVHPRAAPIYQTVFPFERIGGERRYVGLNEGARAVALALPMAGVEERMRSRFAARGDVVSNPWWLHFGMPMPNIAPVAEALARSEERIESMEALARARMDIFRSLSDAEIAFLRGTVKGVLWPSRSRSAFEDLVDATNVTAAHAVGA